jgi:hypothetical protein
VWSDVTSRSTEAHAASSLAGGARALLSAAAVRNAAHRMWDLALGNELEDWEVDLERLPATADLVAKVVKDRYPRLDPPVHARWRHFEIAGRDLWEEIASRRDWRNPAARARAEFDLVIASVLLDAGAGPDWRYHDAPTGLTLGRSEGLALASLRWFEAGGLSTDPGDPLRVDAAALRNVDARALHAAFQSTPDNPLLGAEGRATLLNRLGAVIEARTEVFASVDAPRPGGLFDAMAARAQDQHLPAAPRHDAHLHDARLHAARLHAARLHAATILATLLDALGPIWQNRPALDGVPLGDCWPHPAFQGATAADGFVPLHKLSQWLSYSLFEPLERAGISIGDPDELTGLAEYRNGGLFADMGVLVPRDPTAWVRVHDVSAPFVVGWRALTVALLDRIARPVRERLGVSAPSFPLACVLEGGTWAAGRLIAQQRRPGGTPPFQISSDGTVF